MPSAKVSVTYRLCSKYHRSLNFCSNELQRKLEERRKKSDTQSVTDCIIHSPRSGLTTPRSEVGGSNTPRSETSEGPNELLAKLQVRKNFILSVFHSDNYRPLIYTIRLTSDVWNTR